MEPIDNNAAPKCRIADQTLDATIDGTDPDAPAIPAASVAARPVPLRAVASMCVKADGISFFATPAAALLEHGHYMLSAAGAILPQVAVVAAQPHATYPGVAPIASTPELQQLKAMTDDEITRVWQDMPGGAAGWLKLFGYLQFARAIESKVAARIERAASPTAASGDELPKTWQDRAAAVRAQGIATDDERPFMREEIADLRAAVSAATKPTADLSKLTRYNRHLTASADGAFFLVTDVRSLLATKPAAAPTLPGCLADRLYEAIEIARSRAQHAGSTPRMKKWDDTAADLRAALAAAPMASADAVIEAKPDLEQLMMEKRIELIPEYEGEWRANVYGDSDVYDETATGRTPSAAVEAALKRAAQPNIQEAGK